MGIGICFNADSDPDAYSDPDANPASDPALQNCRVCAF